MEQLAPHEKVFVDEDIFDDDENHGSIDCEECHGGDPEEKDFEAAHKNVVRDPSYPAPGICLDCHDSEHYAKSLHVTLEPIRQSIFKRASDDEMTKAKLNQAFDNHCVSCHSSCGQCHISRPESVGGGLLAGHAYEKRAPEKETCTACHGSRVGNEYFGKGENCTPDVHQQKAYMKCQKCHKSAEMHGQPHQAANRYNVTELPKCLDCHEEIYTAKGRNQENHKQHKDRVSCQVCHAQPYTNCFSCHVKVSPKGQKYYEVESHRVDFKIGLNPNPTPRHPEKFVTVRHVPVDQDTFKHYADGALSNFDKVPTWKLATPHNIQLRTPQNSDCNNCHDNKRLFLRPKDVPERYRKANMPVIVPSKEIPQRIDLSKASLNK